MDKETASKLGRGASNPTTVTTVNNTNTKKMPTYKEAWEKGGKALSDKYGGDYSKFETAAKKYNATKNEGGKPGTYKTNMKDLALNTQARRDEYDRRGWQHDSTTKVKPKPNNNAVGKGGNNNSSINTITSNTQGTGGNKVAGSSMKPITLKTDLDAALKSKFGANSATSTSNMSLMKGKVDAPKSVVDQTGIPDASELESRPSVYDRKGREKIGGMSYSDGENNTFFGKGSMKTKGENTKRERDVLYNEEGKKMGTVKRNMETNTYDVKRTRRGKAAEKARLEKNTQKISNEDVVQSLYDQQIDKYL